MQVTRRGMTQMGVAGIAGLQSSGLTPVAALAADGDHYAIDHGEIVILPVHHASFVMKTPSMVIYNDPVGGPALYKGYPKPDLILVTHQHPDHFDVKTLQGLVGAKTKLITNPAVFDLLPDDLKARAKALANGGVTTTGTIKITAVPAYNTTPDRLKYHPKGRDNGYVLTIDGKRVYIAGDTEDIPEMRAMKNIDIAFVPMNLPFTMDIDQAASAVAEFAPAYVYPYHYKGSDVKAFAAKVAASGALTKVVLGHWY